MHFSRDFEAVSDNRPSCTGICNREQDSIIACAKESSTEELNRGTTDVARAQALDSAPTMSEICCPTPIPKMQRSLTTKEDKESVTRKPQFECNACKQRQRMSLRQQNAHLFSGGAEGGSLVRCRAQQHALGFFMIDKVSEFITVITFISRLKKATAINDDDICTRVMGLWIQRRRKVSEPTVKIKFNILGISSINMVLLRSCCRLG